MTKPLVIVESPTKIKTIQKYLGQDYNIAATVGHLKDLPGNEIGIDLDDNFKPHYNAIPGKEKIIKALKKAAGDAQVIYLAPDPDREGEAIAWHTAEILKKKDRVFYRVLFHELTQNAIQKAMLTPSELDKHRYDAQQARRVLDRLVGYQISPLLWRKVRSGLSAGRVQSVAVRIICERERAIHAFESEEYWTITAQLQAATPPPFLAKLIKSSQGKIHIPNAEAAQAILAEIKPHPALIDQVKKKTVKRNPLPPFITSKMQQEAIRRLRFSAKKTMMVAQQLYEGVALESGEQMGLITYMRTDSTRIAAEAAQEAISFISATFGQEYAIDRPRFFKNRKKAQDAHEAIRPTAVAHTPESIARFLNEDQLNLYRLIWQRFVASQMKEALIDQQSVTIRIGSYLFQAGGSTVKFPGFMALYKSAEDTAETEEKEVLPELAAGQPLAVAGYDPKQHFTQPPPRFSEATLVKELEENGIGRPSTYAAILTTIREKGYVEMTNGHFRPSELGFIVNDLIVACFPDVLDVEFTAKLEDDLDKIEQNELDYLRVLTDFYTPFKQMLDAADQAMLNIKGVGFPTDLKCPLCQRRIHIKVGKNGHFLACSGYPDCKYSRDYIRDEKGGIKPVEPPADASTNIVCSECGKPMLVKFGKFGAFLACSGYPDCRHTQSLETENNQRDTGIPCPSEGCTGKIAQKKSKRGKVFYGCNRYPECTFAIWDKPIPEPCPECGHNYLLEKISKKSGVYLLCPNPDCGYRLQK